MFNGLQEIHGGQSHRHYSGIYFISDALSPVVCWQPIASLVFLGDPSLRSILLFQFPDAAAGQFVWFGWFVDASPGPGAGPVMEGTENTFWRGG